MKLSLQLTGKIWLSVSIIIMGYALSTMVGTYYGLQAKLRLSQTNEVLFPATQISSAVLTQFNKLVQLYDDAVVLGDKEKLKESKQTTLSILRSLGELREMPLPEVKISAIDKLIKRISSFSADALRVYPKLIPDALETEVDGSPLPGASSSSSINSRAEQELEGEAKEDHYYKLAGVLAEETETLEIILEDLSQDFASDLQNGLEEIITRDDSRRKLGIVLFVLVVLGSIIVIAVVVRRFITVPMAQTVTMLENLGRGNLNSRLGFRSTDEIGRMALAMDAFVENLNQKVEIAESIAAGNLSAEVTLASQEDTLGTAMGTMLKHLKANRVVIEDNIANLKAQALKLREANSELMREITERKEAEKKLANAQQKLIETSRQAGMAEIATGVLHNVGNVLNSVNVSAILVADKVRNSQISGLQKASELIERNKDDLAPFFIEDSRGKQLPRYLYLLSQHLDKERTEVLTEVSSLLQNIAHIKEIVNLQQNYAKVSGILEILNVKDLIEDAIRINRGRLEKYEVEVERHYASLDPIQLDRQKVLQILVNLIKNAADALGESKTKPATISVRTKLIAPNTVRITVTDNGIGISQDALTRIFAHGFTTKKKGHGFGLHSGALAAKEMGGSLVAQSEGPGRGASFLLDLPFSENVED